MRVEINNVREVKEVTLDSVGRVQAVLPEFAGHLAKLIILDNTGIDNVETKNPTRTTSTQSVKKNIGLDGIEGKRYSKGQPRSRLTAVDFARLVKDHYPIDSYNQTWIQLQNGQQLRYSLSVVYEGMDGDYLWFSVSRKDLVEHLVKDGVTMMGKSILVFLIRDSDKCVWIAGEDIADLVRRMETPNNKDWLNINILFKKSEIVFHFKMGDGIEPASKTFLREEHYIHWTKFIEIMKRRFVDE